MPRPRKYPKMTSEQEVEEAEQLNIAEVSVEPVKPVEKPAVDPANPKEGDTIITAEGDKEVFHNGAWIVYVSGNPNV